MGFRTSPKSRILTQSIRGEGRRWREGNGEREADSGKWRERDKGIDEGATHQGPSDEVLSV
jgi:hypothetical protein